MTTRKQVEFWEYGPGRLFNPFFWDHPTPVNLLILSLVFLALVYVCVWIGWSAWNFLPWPPLFS